MLPNQVREFVSEGPSRSWGSGADPNAPIAARCRGVGGRAGNSSSCRYQNANAACAREVELRMSTSSSRPRASRMSNSCISGLALTRQRSPEATLNRVAAAKRPRIARASTWRVHVAMYRWPTRIDCFFECPLPLWAPKRPLRVDGRAVFELDFPVEHGGSNLRGQRSIRTTGRSRRRAITPGTPRSRGVTAEPDPTGCEAILPSRPACGG